MKFKIDKEKLSAAIKAKRGQNSYGYIAEQIGISATTVSYLESGGHTMLSVTTYASICHWLGVSLYHFLIMDGEELNSLISKNIENNEQTESKLRTGR